MSTDTAEWICGWQTNSQMYNYSTTSVPKLFMSDARLNVYEYQHRALQARTISLWSSDELVDATVNEMQLTLSNDGCLEMKNMWKESVIWSVCGEFENTDTDEGEDDDDESERDSRDMTTTQHVLDDNDSANADTNANNTGSALTSWWFWIVVVVCGCFVIVLCVVGVRRYLVHKEDNTPHWVSTSTATVMNHRQNDASDKKSSLEAHNSQESGSQSGAIPTDDIEQWIQTSTAAKYNEPDDMPHEEQVQVLQQYDQDLIEMGAMNAPAPIVDETNYNDYFGESNHDL